MLVAMWFAAMVFIGWGFSRLVSSVTAGTQLLSTLEEDSVADEAESAPLEDVSELNMARQNEAAGEDAPLVLCVDIAGEITAEEQTTAFWQSDSGSAAAALRSIRRATLDSRIEGIFLRIDSPGGEVSISDEVWKALVDFRASEAPGDTPRFVVALMGGTAASGAYYICAAADRIVARPTTITGSIGVKMSSVNVRALADKLGVKEVAIVSGTNKNILSPFDELTEEQRSMLQAQVDALHSRFVTLVAEGRHLDEKAVRAIADGRILLAQEAKDAGLIDTIGYLDDAKSAVSGFLNGATPRYVSYGESVNLLKTILSPSFLGATLRNAALPEGSAAGYGASLKAKGF
jgi:protease-4